MTFKFKNKFKDLKIFQNLIKKVKCDAEKRVDFENFMEVLDINDTDIVNKLGHFVK